jgi:hypothetical protein
MKIEDLIINECYTRYDDAEFMILYKTDKWFIALDLSHNHKIAVPQIYDQKWLDEDYNKNFQLMSEGDYPMYNYINDFDVVDEYTLKLY